MTALTLAAQAAVIGWIVLRVIELFGGTRRPLDALARLIGPDSLKLAALVAAAAMAGSLYMSEVRHFPPCVLCWYQRIAMYPLVLILGIGAVRRDLTVRFYAIPLALIGIAISVYHYQLERFPDQETVACTKSVPCTTIWFEQLGYITIPMMALSAFALICVVLTVGGRHGQVITK
ncbi:MAG: disulfide oxidoreductase [Gaiellales bacterium]